MILIVQMRKPRLRQLIYHHQDQTQLVNGRAGFESLACPIQKPVLFALSYTASPRMKKLSHEAVSKPVKWQSQYLDPLFLSKSFELSTYCITVCHILSWVCEGKLKEFQIKGYLFDFKSVAAGRTNELNVTSQSKERSIFPSTLAKQLQSISVS